MGSSSLHSARYPVFWASTLCQVWPIINMNSSCLAGSSQIQINTELQTTVKKKSINRGKSDGWQKEGLKPHLGKCWKWATFCKLSMHTGLMAIILWWPLSLTWHMASSRDPENKWWPVGSEHKHCMWRPGSTFKEKIVFTRFPFHFPSGWNPGMVVSCLGPCDWEYHLRMSEHQEAEQR